jgi:hypothetical protein
MSTPVQPQLQVDVENQFIGFVVPVSTAPGFKNEMATILPLTAASNAVRNAARSVASVKSYSARLMVRVLVWSTTSICTPALVPAPEVGALLMRLAGSTKLYSSWEVRWDVAALCTLNGNGLDTSGCTREPAHVTRRVYAVATNGVYETV